MAVSLSGGGYRATTFHLGSLSYLDARDYAEEPLLERVKIISTISGGTLTGVMYALKLAQGQSFSDCFEKLYILLTDDRLVDLALEKLNAPNTWKNSDKTRDLINAFSEVYHEQFFDQQTFATLYDGTKTHLGDAIFGTSEFTFGKQFRMQEVDDQGWFGNGYLHLPESVAREIRLADAAAASSCFPGGFEPMIMPKDFANGNKSNLTEKWIEKGYQTTAIMDGGVIDNQGIEGVKLAEQRNNQNGDQDFIGTYIISDVSGQMMKSYKVPKRKSKTWMNIFTARRINIVSILASLGIIAFLIIGGDSEIAVIVSTIFLTLFSIWLIAYALITKEVKTTIMEMFGDDDSPELLDHLKVINRTPFPVLFYLAKLRATSVMKMVSDVFLKRIRSLQLAALFQSEDWNYRIKTNNIYTLLNKEDISNEMQKVIKHANSMPTTLWFSETEKQNGMLDDLIACGQLTMCYNLITYIERIQSEARKEKIWDVLSKTQQKDIERLNQELKTDWGKFETDPHWMLKDYKAKMAPIG